MSDTHLNNVIEASVWKTLAMKELKGDYNLLATKINHLEQTNIELKQTSLELKQINVELKQTTVELKQANVELKEEILNLKKENVILKNETTQIKQDCTKGDKKIYLAKLYYLWYIIYNYLLGYINRQINYY